MLDVQLPLLKTYGGRVTLLFIRLVILDWQLDVKALKISFSRTFYHWNSSGNA
jgi:hypothetical protein